MAPARAGRPHDVGGPRDGAGCPFCSGREDETPPEVMAVRPAGGPPGSPGWLVRVVPNKYPALPPECGVHEVILNTPRHVERLADLTDEEAGLAGEVWAQRVAATGADPRGLWPFLFLNQGAAAGASLQHTHTQVVGLPFAPPRLVARERAFEEAAVCPICEDLGDAGDRLVDERDGLVAWCPRVPPLSGAVRIAPRRHASSWEHDPGPAAAARFLRAQAQAAGERLRADAINLWLNQPRPDGSGRYHWHIDLIPRLGTLAGLELGAGVIAVAQRPEDTAARLRGEPPSRS